MNHTVLLKPIAVQMAKEAYDWYEEQKIGLGDLFLNELEKSYIKIEKNPFHYQKLKKSYRHFVLDKFPYVLIFEITENEIIIFAVFHTSRNPRLKFKNK